MQDVRRKVLKGMGAIGGGIAAPSFYMLNAWAADFRNNPGKAKTVAFGFNVPQTGAYADEGADELRAYKLAVKHLNGEGDGWMMKTLRPSSLKGNGVLGKKVVYVNRYLEQVYRAGHNREFGVCSTLPGTAYVPFISGSLPDILCEHHERTVGNDNCVAFAGLSLQIPCDEFRHHYVRTRVRVHRYVDDTLAVFHEPRKLAAYDAHGLPTKEQEVQRLAA